MLTTLVRIPIAGSVSRIAYNVEGVVSRDGNVPVDLALSSSPAGVFRREPLNYELLGRSVNCYFLVQKAVFTESY